MSPTRDLLLSMTAAAVLFLVLVRCIVPISPNLYFDGDPRLAVRITDSSESPKSPAPAPGGTQEPANPKSDAGSRTVTPPSLTLGPAGAAWLDALALAVAGLALMLHAACGGSIRWMDLSLVLAGGIFAAIHLPRHVDNIYIGGGWIGAASLAAATLHLAQHAAARRWLVAALVALAVPLLIDAASYVFVDHAQTLSEFNRTEDAFLEARGWTRGSPEHELFLRRMMLGEPTGAFAFSNVLGSVAAMLAALGAVWAWGLFAAKTTRKLAILPAILAAAGAAIVVLTTSKGAPVALMMAMTLAVASAWLVARSKPALLRFLPWAGIAMIVVAIGVVVVRGAMGPPESDQGERSLLFRWQYWQASARIAGSSADTLILGAGPAGFSEAYPAAKNPLNPEEVRSAHSVFIDWIVLLGIGGWAWTALALMWFWRAGKVAAETLASSADSDSGPLSSAGERERAGVRAGEEQIDEIVTPPQASLFDIPLPDLFLALALTAALFGFEAAVKWESLLIPERFLPWAGGMMAFLFVTSVLSNPRWTPTRWLPLALFVAAAALLIHNQIEMSFFQPSSAPLVWFVLALAASESQPSSDPLASDSAGKKLAVRKFHWLSALPGVALLIFATAFAGTIAGPVSRQQRLLADASDKLRHFGDSRDSEFHFIAADLLAKAGDALPMDPKPYEWRSRLALEAAANHRRFLATNPPPQVRHMVAGEMRQLTQQAIATLEQAAGRGLDTLSLHRQRAMTLVHAADLLNDPRYLDEALKQWQRLVIRRPYVWQDRIDLADLLWRTNRQGEARQQYRAALEMSDLYYLDPARQMGKADREHCEDRASHR